MFGSVLTWEFPKIRGTLFWVLIIWMYYFGYYIRVPYFRKLPHVLAHVPVSLFVGLLDLHRMRPSARSLVGRLGLGHNECCKH